MSRAPITSSNVVAIGYDGATKTLEVEYKNGGIYQYSDVNPAKYTCLVAAESVGKFIAEHVKGSHTFIKVEADASLHIAERIYREFAAGWGDTGLVTVHMTAVQVTGELTRLLRRITNKIVDEEAQQ